MKRMIALGILILLHGAQIFSSDASDSDSDDQAQSKKGTTSVVGVLATRFFDGCTGFFTQRAERHIRTFVNDALIPSATVDRQQLVQSRPQSNASSFSSRARSQFRAQSPVQCLQSSQLAAHIERNKQRNKDDQDLKDLEVCERSLVGALCQPTRPFKLEEGSGKSLGVQGQTDNLLQMPQVAISSGSNSRESSPSLSPTPNSRFSSHADLHILSDRTRVQNPSPTPSPGLFAGSRSVSPEPDWCMVGADGILNSIHDKSSMS